MINDIIKSILFYILVLLFVVSCTNKEKFECPCGGHGIVAHGTIIEIEQKNSGDTKRILDAVEKEFGGECCEIEN